MPLSEHEQRQLEQIEQSLYADYPKLAQAVRAKDPRVHYRRRMTGAAAGFLIGAGLLLAGVVMNIIPMGAGGIAVMLISVVWALTSWRHMRSGTRGPRRPRRSRVQGTPRGARPRGAARGVPRGGRMRGGSGQKFMERLEERWRRRQERGQF